jgi:hypothetical protein
VGHCEEWGYSCTRGLYWKYRVNVASFFPDDSDLNLVIDKESFTCAAPMFDHGFGYIWAGARSTYGFQKGKVFYEVKVSKLFI